MKKTLLVLVCITFTVLGMAQTKSDPKKDSTKTTTKKEIVKPAPKKAVVKPVVITEPKKDWTKVDLSKRPADHFMMQYGYDGWTNRPDSVHTAGFSRHFNFYFMLDKPIKGNPKFSLAFGAGLGSSNIFFSGTRIDIKSIGNTLPFTKADSSDHFHKLKITTIYLQAPVEFRYFSNPENPDKSWKAAVGMKLGTLINAYTKGKDYQNKNGASYYGPSYIQKEYDNKFFNTTSVDFTLRFGYGIVSLDGGFAATPVLKTGAGPAMNKFSIGLTISGL